MERSINSDVCLFSRLFHRAVSVADDVSVEWNIVFDEFERSRVEIIFLFQLTILAFACKYEIKPRRYSVRRMDAAVGIWAALFADVICRYRSVSRWIEQNSTKYECLEVSEFLNWIAYRKLQKPESRIEIYFVTFKWIQNQTELANYCSMLITSTSKTLKILSLCLNELSLFTDRDKDGRTLMNLILMRYCEGMELVKQVVTDSSC
jgi:hypothetical protein